MIKLNKKYYKVNLENPIKKKKYDIFGYDYEVRRIKNAIKNDANVIGIISEYGSGKSSLIQLLKKKLCFLRYKVINVNLWDNHLIEESNNPSNSIIVRLHKNFLRQVSSQTKKYNSAYINRRINANYGVAKISFPSYKSLIKWFIIYIGILLCLLYMTCRYVYNINSFNDISISDRSAFITNILSKTPIIFLGFVFFYILFNKEVLFSFWNNSKSRDITEEDTIQIYNELLGKKFECIPRFKKIIIIIEDLDRIDNSNLVGFYLNEFYRLYIEGNEKNKRGITLIFCLKDDRSNSYQSKYVKIFDYISYINQINIDDKDEILRQLIKRDKLLFDLSYDKNTGDINTTKLSWLVEGKEVNIRTIKRRMEHFKSIYLRICSRANSRNNNIVDLDININTCAFAAFLRTEYNSELDSILNNYDSDNLNFIDRCVNKKIIGESIEKITFENSDKNSINFDTVNNLIIDMVNSDNIDSDYKKYFYNFPKGTKIYTTTEKYVSDFITNNNNVDKNNILKNLKTFLLVSDDFILEKISRVNSLGKDIPNICLYEKKSFAAAQKISINKLKDKFKSVLLLNDTNINIVCSTIDLLKESDINRTDLAKIISSIINENAMNEKIELDSIYMYRSRLVECFGSNIVYFDNLYNNNQISKDEISKINEAAALLSISKIIHHDEEIDKLLSERFNELNENNKEKYIIELLSTFCNWKTIYSLDVANFTDALKQNIYSEILKKNITGNEKIKLLLYINYISIDIAEDLLDDKAVSENLVIEYLNKQKKYSDKCIHYVENCNKLYDISNDLFNSLEKGSEKYYAYYIYRNHTLPVNCDDNMLTNIFLNYSELTYYFKDSYYLSVIRKNKIYKLFNERNITNDKLLILIELQQTKNMVKVILEKKNIPMEYKCFYVNNIKYINKDASNYFLTLIDLHLSKELSNSIYKNRECIFSNFDKVKKINITKKLKKSSLND